MSAESPKTLEHEPQPIRRRATAEAQIRAIIWGNPGAGKTTFGLTFPNPLVIDTDKGLEGDAVADPDLPGEDWEPENYADINTFYFWVKSKLDDKHYDTIVIDSLPSLYNFLLHEAIRVGTKGKSLTQIDAAAASQPHYGQVQRAIEQLLTKLTMLGKHVVITAGIRQPDLEKGWPTKRTFDAPPSLHKVLEHWANLIGELVVVRKDDKEVRGIRTDPSDDLREGNKARWSALRPSITPPTFETVMAGIRQSG